MSRSVTTPTNRPFSTTGRMPQSPSSISAAADARFESDEQVLNVRRHDVLDLHFCVLSRYAAGVTGFVSLNFDFMSLRFCFRRERHATLRGRRPRRTP